MTAAAAVQTSAAPAEAARPDFQRIPLEQLHESPLNPRRVFDPAALAELSASLLQTGQLTPIIVRPRKAGGYEIAAGHRRYRAAKLACENSPEGAAFHGLRMLEAKVVAFDERAFVEILNIENLQRDDLQPLEEAAGFRDLMQRAGYGVAKIAARIGRSEKYIYDRVKLLQLVKEAQKLLWDGQITAGHAILLARLSPADQKRAIGDPRDVNEYSYGRAGGGLFRPDHSDELDLDDAIQPRSVRELQAWINDNVRMTEKARSRREQERARWKKAAPAIREALAEKLKVAPASATSAIGRAVLDEVTPRGTATAFYAKYVPVGRTAEDLLRHLAFIVLEDVLDAWDVDRDAPKVLKPFGIDPVKIVDQVAPKPESEKKQTPAKKPATKKGARK